MSEIDPGDATLRTYEQVADSYAAHRPAPHPAVVAFLDRVARLVGGGTVLELGSGPGVDADYLERHGVRITRSDAAVAFVQRLRRRGHRALRLDIRTDAFGGPWDGVLANAVLLHLTAAQLTDVVARLTAAVRPGGVLALTLKEGDGDGWTTAKVDRPRYFRYWREGPIRAVLDAAGWSTESVEHVAGPQDDWLYVIARAPAPGSGPRRRRGGRR